MRVRRLFPDAAETTVDEQLAAYLPGDAAGADRPVVAVNFAVTLDGRAAIDGSSRSIGSQADTSMLVGLRTRFDAVMIGGGTMRAERYARLVADPDKRARRERIGLPHDPLAVIISGSLDLPWDAPLFTAGGGRVLIFTSSAEDPPATETSLRVVRHAQGVDASETLRYLRQERGIRSVLCEGGPRLHAQLQAAGTVDEIFLTTAPKLVGGEAPRILEGALPETVRLELAWLLESEGELFARYRC